MTGTTTLPTFGTTNPSSNRATTTNVSHFLSSCYSFSPDSFRYLCDSPACPLMPTTTHWYAAATAVAGGRKVKKFEHQNSIGHQHHSKYPLGNFDADSGKTLALCFKSRYCLAVGGSPVKLWTVQFRDSNECMRLVILLLLLQWRVSNINNDIDSYWISCTATVRRWMWNCCSWIAGKPQQNRSFVVAGHHHISQKPLFYCLYCWLMVERINRLNSQLIYVSFWSSVLKSLVITWTLLNLFL